MIPQETPNGRKWTNIILVVITISILVYVCYVKGIGLSTFSRNVTLENRMELLNLDEKEKSFVGVNNKQIIKVTADGINAYNFENTEIWSDTFSMNNFVVKQKEPYVAVGDKQGKKVILYNTKGKQTEINANHPIVYFTVNETGSVVTIESEDNSYTIAAYDKTGKYLCGRVSYVSTDGYPTAAVLSPDNSLLLMSYVSVDDPQVTSNILAMKVKEIPDGDEKVDNIAFGYIEKNNLVYHIEYMSKNTWVCVGDKAMTWYDNEGHVKGKQNDLSLVFQPELIKTNGFGSGYLPIVYSPKPTQNVVHRQDQLAYYNEQGEQTYKLALEGGAGSYYADDNGVIVEVNGVYKGYNKLCNQIFEYAPSIDISKVIYVPSIKKGIAVGKEKVYLIAPQKGEGLK